jgi:hypothetical protein
MQAALWNKGRSSGVRFILAAGTGTVPVVDPDSERAGQVSRITMRTPTICHREQDVTG